MKGKLPLLILVACLAAFGYLFILNPSQVAFRLFHGAPVRTNLALLVFIAFLAGFGLAFLSGIGQEVLLGLRFWRQRRLEERREKGRSLSSAGRGLLAGEKPGAAAKTLRKAYRRLPGDPSVAVDLARAEAGQGRLEASEARLKALLEDDPANPEALDLLLDIQRRRGDVEGQQASLAKKLEADPKHRPSLRALRDLYRRLGKWSEAIRVQEKVVARTEGREERAGERRMLSELLVCSAGGQPAALASAQLKRAVEEDRSYAPAHAALGEVLASQEDSEGACRVWLRGYDATGQIGLLLKAEAVRLGQGRGDELLKIYRKLGKKRSSLMLLEARLLISLDRADEALDLLERLGATLAGTAAVEWLTGEALFHLRSFERSANALRQSLGGTGETPVLRFACSACGATSVGWEMTCTSCGAMDSLQLNLGRSITNG